jgi:leucyl/phenylalanyl-tRNA---protein transferase
MKRIAILVPGSADPFPAVEAALAEPNGLLAAGGDLSSGRLLDAYRHGIFPWFGEGDPILWWSPDPRAVFPPDRVHVSSSLRRWLKRCGWTLRADTMFAEVMRACAAPRADQPGTWITPEMLAAYRELHDLGHAHSVEVCDQTGRMVGGLYGVAVGRMFFAESMFSVVSNGSKVALVALCRALHGWGFPLLDAQLPSAHLTSMGAVEMPRREFVERVASVCALRFEIGKWTGRWPILNAAVLAKS